MVSSASTDRDALARTDHAEKVQLAEGIEHYYDLKRAELRLGDVDLAAAYLPGAERFFDRGLFIGQRGLDTVIDAVLEEREWAVVSGLNPSGPLHLGHKAMLDTLLWLQQDHGATVYIPLTDDESYLVGKASSVAQAQTAALTDIIPSIIALGFSPDKTRIFLHSQYHDIYKLAVTVSRYTTYNNVRGLFGWEGHENPGMVFYMGALQFASILLPQVAELGGKKPVLVPVGIDQHPYISLARDVARKLAGTLPSELVWRFMSGLRTPGKKMSTSTPGDAIFLTDTPEVATQKIRHAYSGGVSVLSAHRELGAVPEVCAAFEVLTYNLEDQREWLYLQTEYRAGRIRTSDIKGRAIELVTGFLKEHNDRREESRARVSEFLFDQPLPSVNEVADLFQCGKSRDVPYG